MNDQTMIASFASIGVVLYVIIGRTVINLLDERRVEPDEWKFFKIFIFPIVIVWEGIVAMSNHLTDAIIHLFDSRMRTKKSRRLRNR